MFDIITRRALIALGLSTALGVGTASVAADDHDDAKRLRRSGEIMPLQELLRQRRGRRNDRVLDVELERKRGNYVYEVESLDERGRVRKDIYDARTGRALGSKRRK